MWFVSEGFCAACVPTAQQPTCRLQWLSETRSTAHTHSGRQRAKVLGHVPDRRESLHTHEKADVLWLQAHQQSL